MIGCRPHRSPRLHRWLLTNGRAVPALPPSLIFPPLLLAPPVYSLLSIRLCLICHSPHFSLHLSTFIRLRVPPFFFPLYLSRVLPCRYRSSMQQRSMRRIMAAGPAGSRQKVVRVPKRGCRHDSDDKKRE